MKYILQLSSGKFFVSPNLQTEFIGQASDFHTKDAAESASLRIVGSQVIEVPTAWRGNSVYSAAPLTEHPDFRSNIADDVIARAKSIGAKVAVILALILFGAIAAQAQDTGGLTATDVPVETNHHMERIAATPVSLVGASGTDLDFQPNNSVVPLADAIKRGLQQYAELHNAVDLGEAARKYRAARRASGHPCDSLIQ